MFVFSIGGESLAVAQNTYAVSWFKGKELNLVFGLQLSMARLVRVLLRLHSSQILINHIHLICTVYITTFGTIAHWIDTKNYFNYSIKTQQTNMAHTN